jgi:hypothetical protein
MGGRRVWLVWVDTRDIRGDVVQYVDWVSNTISGAKARVNRINTHTEEYPNMVAWYEETLTEGDGTWLKQSEYRNPRAKLIHENVTEIKKRHAQGEKINALSNEFGVHRNTISRIVNGASWQDLQEAA